jgi:hypothetical protein
MSFVCRNSNCSTIRGETWASPNKSFSLLIFESLGKCRSTRISTSWMSGGVLIGIIIGVNGGGVMGIVWNSESQIKVESSPNGVFHDAFMAT